MEWGIPIAIAAGIALLFGVKKIPEFARNIGRAQGEFKKGLREGVVEEDSAAPAAKAADDTPPPTPPPPTVL